MGFVLDAIRRSEILDQSEVVVMDYASPSFSLDDRDGEFSVSLFYSNGSSVNMRLFLEISSDNVNFAEVGGTEQFIADPSGMHIWDIAGSGALYARVGIQVITGSMQLDRILYVARQRH